MVCVGYSRAQLRSLSSLLKRKLICKNIYLINCMVHSKTRWTWIYFVNWQRNETERKMHFQKTSRKSWCETKPCLNCWFFLDRLPFWDSWTWCSLWHQIEIAIIAWRKLQDLKIAFLLKISLSVLRSSGSFVYFIHYCVISWTSNIPGVLCKVHLLRQLY